MSTTTTHSLEPVLHSFSYALDFLREQVADVAPAQMVAQPTGIANHPAWVIGHITCACQLLGGVIGIEPWLPDDWTSRFGTGSAPLADAGAYASKEHALAMLRDAQSRIVSAVETLDESALDQPFPDPSYRDVFPTVRHALTQVLVGHTSMHVGQISVWRRAMKLPAMTRAFE